MYVYMCPRAHTLFVKCMGLERAGTRGINADRIGFNVTLKLRSETSGTNLCPQNMEYGIRNTGPSRACLEYVEYVFTF